MMNLPPDPASKSQSHSAQTGETNARKPLLLGAVFPLSIQIVAECASTIFTMLVAAVAACIGIILALGAFLGFSRGGVIDPRTVPFLLTNTDWLALGVSVLCMATLLFFAFDGIVQATDAHLDGKTLSIKECLRRTKFDHLWLLWIQLIATALFATVIPWMGLVLWILVASAVPVAMLENRSPNRALDRAWELMAGNLWKVLVVELISVILLAIPPVIVAPLFLGQTSPLGSDALPAWSRTLLAIPFLLAVLAPYAYMFVTLTVMYRQLRQGAES